MKSKETKRMEAEKRQDAYDMKSKEERLQRLNKGKYRAKKERERLGFPEVPADCVN